MENSTKTIDAQQIQASDITHKSFESDIIPSSFWLGGLKIDVIYDENLHKNRRIVGEARYPSQSIVLDSVVLSKQLMEQNFFHELTHWILYVMNEDDLRNNEKFVDVFAYFMHQALVTRHWETGVSQETDGVAATQKEQITDSYDAIRRTLQILFHRNSDIEPLSRDFPRSAIQFILVQNG